MLKYPHSISSKLPEIGTTIFTTMSALAQKHNAINLSQGFPDFDIDQTLVDLVALEMKKGNSQYAPMAGSLRLREAIGAKMQKAYGVKYDINEEITITSGATEAIYSSIAAFVKDEDEVILFTPAYDCYAPSIKLHGGRPVYVQMHAPEYKINWEDVKKLITQKTKMIIINTPHNPTGSILNKSDLLELEKLVKGTEIIVLSDEVYEHIIFEGQAHESACKYKSLRLQTMCVYSFGKTFHVTGWKLGYVVGPQALMKEFRKVHQFNVFSSNTPMQNGIAAYLEHESNYFGLGTFYQEKRDLFLSAIAGSKFKAIKCAGTYFQLLSFEDITDEGDVEFAERLTKEFGLASIPVSVFYHSSIDEKVLRFCFAKENETLLKAGDILQKI